MFPTHRHQTHLAASDLAVQQLRALAAQIEPDDLAGRFRLAQLAVRLAESCGGTWAGPVGPVNRTESDDAPVDYPPTPPDPSDAPESTA